MPAYVTIPVANVASLLALGYTHIEIWLSVDDSNSWVEVTRGPAAALVGAAPARNTYALGGRRLSFIVDGATQFDVDFDPILSRWTPGQAAARINQVATGRAAEISGSTFLNSPTTGRASSVEVVGTVDGFFALGATYGYDGRPALVSGTLLYTYSDVAPVPENARYRWRFSANGANPKSSFSPWVSPTTPPANPGAVSVGYLVCLGLDGRPTQGRLLVAQEMPEALGGGSVNAQMPLAFDADENGFIQAMLLRGAHVRVAIEGTTLVRSFQVPNAPSFDIMQVLSTAPDQFAVQSVPPLSTRRSL